MNTNTQTLLAWQAPVRTSHQRSEKWYLIGGVMCAMAIVYGVMTGAWSLSLTFGMIAGLYFLTRNESHRDHSIVISEVGVEFDGKFHPWNELKEFWILNAPGYSELHLEPKKHFRPEITIQTGTTDPYILRDVLSLYLPQNPNKKERLLDTFIRFCKL